MEVAYTGKDTAGEQQERPGGLGNWTPLGGEPSTRGWALQAVRKMPRGLASLGTLGLLLHESMSKVANCSDPWKISSPRFSRQQGNRAMGQCAGLPTPVSQRMMLGRRKGAEHGVKPNPPTGRAQANNTNVEERLNLEK